MIKYFKYKIDKWPNNKIVENKKRFLEKIRDMTN
jgi:hypothetical protein